MNKAIIKTDIFNLKTPKQSHKDILKYVGTE